MTALRSDPDRLYNLVPVIYRLQDADRGWPLRALLRVIGEQVEVVEQDIAGLYENWFVETCEPWLLPYIGALVGFTPAGGAEAPVSRSEVANTIRLRRRKGTLAALGDVAAAAGGWPVRAVERYRQLAVTQNINHLHLDRGQTAELRNADALSLLSTSFCRTARNVDVRRANSAHVAGLGNIPDVTAFVWRLEARTVTASAAYCYEEEAPNCYLFDVLGRNTQLVQHAPANTAPILPLAITRFALERRESNPPLGEIAAGVPFLYGADKSFAIGLGTPPVPIAPERIVAANLDGWAYRPLPGQVAVDPELGRIMFPPNEVRRQAVTVSYAHAAVAKIGGGEYPRTLRGPAEAIVYTVGLASGTPYKRIADALAAWQNDAPVAAIVEICDSGVYSEPLAITLAAGQSLQLRAASGCRPVLRLLDWQSDAPDVVAISGVRGSWFTLDGLTVTGRGLEIGGEISGVLIRHSTLVPGWGLTCHCDPKRPDEPSIEVVGAPICLTIESSIVGAIRVERDQAADDPLVLHASDSVIDATDPAGVAIGASAKLCADTLLTLRRCTVIGQVQTHVLELAKNTILDGEVLACRRQVGCVRFSALPASSRTPRQYECTNSTPDFDSRRYGAPAYLRLALTCPPEIAQGAGDRSEMGVFHELMQPQRLAAVRQRISEYSPASTNAGVVLSS